MLLVVECATSIYACGFPSSPYFLSAEFDFEQNSLSFSLLFFGIGEAMLGLCT